MSGFLMVVPPDWTEVDVNGVFQSLDPSSIQTVIAGETWWELEQALENSGQLPVDTSVWGARLFDDGAGWRMWVKFGELR